MALALIAVSKDHFICEVVLRDKHVPDAYIAQ